MGKENQIQRRIDLIFKRRKDDITEVENFRSKKDQRVSLLFGMIEIME
jgi:hypothetical protein